MSRKPIDEEVKRVIFGLSDRGKSSYQISKGLGLPYSTVRGHVAAREMGLNSYVAKQAFLASQKGVSLKEYRIERQEENRKKPENLIVSNYIQSNLRRLGKTLKWLAQQIDKPISTVYNWSKGNSLPNIDELSKIYSAFPEHKDQGIEEILNEPNRIMGLIQRL